MKLTRFFIYLFVYIVFLIGCTTKPLESVEQEEIIPVRVENVEKDTFINLLELSGRTKGKQEFPIFAPSPIQVEQVYVQLGQEVKQGDKLLQFSNPELEGQLQEAQSQVAQLEEGVTQLEEMRKEAQKAQEQLTNQSQESIERAQAILNGAQTGAVTMFDLLEASTQLLLMQNQLQNIGDPNQLTAFSPQQLVIQQEQANAQVRTLKRAIEQLTVNAPFDGVITVKNIGANEMALPNTPLLQLSNVEQITVDMQVGSTQVNQLKQGMKARIWVEGKNQPIEARLDALSPGVSIQGNLYQAQIFLDNQDRALFPGQFVKIEVETEHIEDALLVPVQAIFFQDDQAFVYTVEEKKAIRKKINIGERSRNSYHVLSGLSEQDVVITLGQERVTDGRTVYIQK